MNLSAEDVRIILEALANQYGPGYAPGTVGKLQAKLSVMLEAKLKLEGKTADASQHP